MFDSLNIEPESFGLDISDLSLKFVKLEKKKKFFNLSFYTTISVKPGIIEGGKIKDKEAFIAILKTAREKIIKSGFKNSNVIASLPENKAFFQVVKMPKMSKEELKTAIPFEAENYIPLSSNDAYFDFEIISQDKGLLDVLVVAVPKEIVDSYLYCLKEVGFVVQALEIESQAIARALIRGKKIPPTLIIDFGRSITSLIFFSGKSIKFTCSIPFSSSDITEVISREMNESFNKAEKMKIKYGLEIGKRKEPNKALENKKVVKIIEEIVSDLAKQIERYIDYYQDHTYGTNHSSEKKVEKVVLCGGGANLKGLDDFLELKLGIPVEKGNPWVNILPSPLREVPEISYEDSLGYTTALGLAIRGEK